MKKLFEVFLTSELVTSEKWLTFLNTISSLNGKLQKWNMWVQIENSEVRYFVEYKKELPTVISSLGDFLLKKQEDTIKIHSSFHFFYFFINIFKKKEVNILDVYDYNETNKNRQLKYMKIQILSIKKDYFRFHTNLYFQNEQKKLVRKLAFFSIPQDLLSIDFSEHNRFVYKKDACKYLNIERSLHLLKSDEKDAVLKVDAFPYLAGNYYLKLQDYDFDKHSIVVGASGTGKSKWISSFISNLENREEYRRNYKVVVIDPHASLEEDIGGLENTSVIDFKKLQTSVDLFLNTGKDNATTTELIISLLKGLMTEQYNSKLERVLRHSIYTLLVCKSLNFTHLRSLILELEYRNIILKKFENELPESTIQFFANDFNELKNKSYQEAISPIISLIDEMQMLPAFRNGQIQQNIQNSIQHNFLTIFSLDQAILGEKVSKTIAGLVMQQLLELVQSHTFDEHIIFVVDEVAVIENDILHRFLSEARKYHVSLILAQQYFNQISEKLQKAIFANVLNYYVFRVSKEDAGILEGNIQMEMAVRNSYHVKRELLTKLSDRECIVRVSSQGVILSAMKARTVDFIPNPKKKLNQIVTKPFLVETNEKEAKIAKSISSEKMKFKIGENICLKDLMISQSAGRKVIGNHG